VGWKNLCHEPRTEKQIKSIALSMMVL